MQVIQTWNFLKPMHSNLTKRKKKKNLRKISESAKKKKSGSLVMM